MLSESSLLKKRISITLGADAATASAAAGFAALFCVVEAMYSGSGIMTAFRALGASDDLLFQGVYVFYLALTFYVLFAFVLVTMTARLPFKVALLSIFSLACLVEYSYLQAVERFTSYADVVAAVSATSEQRQHSLSAFFSPVGIVPAAGLAAVSFLFGPSERRSGALSFVTVLIIPGLFFVHLSFVNRYLFDREFHSSSFSAFGQTIADTALYAPIEQMSPVVRRAVRQVEPQARPANNIVLVFDESIRADHLSLNGYARKTTPYLEQLEKRGELINWGTAVSASTSSHTAYNAFITGITPDEFSQMNMREVNSLPTMFQYARAAGYKTYLIDGQMMDYWGGAMDDLNYIDDHVSLARIDNPGRKEDWQRGTRITNEDIETNALKQWDIDTKIARMTRQVFEGSTGNFIFVYKRGAHFPYEKNYPADQAVWQPVYRFKDQYEIPPEESLEAVVNSYDNALRFNLDGFFRTLADDYSALPNGTVIVYTSDHGESFYKNGRAGHGGDTPSEANVPLFTFGMKRGSVDERFRASHHNLFATLLDLMNYPKGLRDGAYSASLFEARSVGNAPRFFNTPTGKKVRFDP